MGSSAAGFAIGWWVGFGRDEGVAAVVELTAGRAVQRPVRRARGAVQSAFRDAVAATDTLVLEPVGRVVVTKWESAGLSVCVCVCVCVCVRVCVWCETCLSGFVLMGPLARQYF